MPKAEYRNAIRSKQLINNALAQLLHEKPLDKITVSEVVRKANINRSTFYAHYSDIPQVLNQLILHTFDEIHTVFKQQQKTEHAPSQILKQIQIIMENDMDFYKTIMTSSAAPMLQQQLANIVLDSFDFDKKTSFCQDSTTYELQLAFFTGGLMRLYQNWFEGKLEISLDQLTEKAAQMIYCVIYNNDINASFQI